MTIVSTDLFDLINKLGLLVKDASESLLEDELLRRYCESLKSIFVDCNCCIRLIDSKTGELTNAYATGSLHPDRREVLVLSPDCFEAGVIPDEIRKFIPSSVNIADESICIFKEANYCICVAIYSGEEILGFLNIETSRNENFSKEEKAVAFLAGKIFTHFLLSSVYLRQLHYMKDYLNKVFDRANIPIAVLDSGKRVKSFNKAMERATGYAKEDMIGGNFSNILPEQDRGRFISAITNTMQKREVEGFEVRIPRKVSGDVVPLVLNFAYVEDFYGNIEDCVVIGQDLSEIRRLQNQMLHSERLATVGQLAAGVVHEINNPLTSISVYSEYLIKKFEKGGGDEADIGRLKKISQAADRILKFTKELMNYARPASEEPMPLDLREILNIAVGFCEHIITKCSVTVKRDFPDSLPFVYGIKGQMVQVFVNLITNACHAMKETGGNLLLKVVNNGDGTVGISVEDTGTGIPTNIIDRVFEPFFTTKAEGEGTGLGLSIVKNIIQNHQGDIKIQSELGRGTKVNVTLFTLE